MSSTLLYVLGLGALNIRFLGTFPHTGWTVDEISLVE